MQLLRRTQLFGQQRFASKVLTTAEENIRLLFAISHHVNKGADPCVENGREQCRDQICVPLSSARFTCVAVENFARPQYAENVQNVDPILPDPIAANPSAHKKKMGGVAKFFVRLLSACLFGCVFGVSDDALSLFIEVGLIIRYCTELANGFIDIDANKLSLEVCNSMSNV